MISIPLEFVPSRLLTCEMVSQHAKRLLAHSRQALAEKRWADAERCALDARDASQRQVGRMVDYAIALIHLADIYRAVGRLGPALESNQYAQQMLKNQPGPIHYHNRAVADYALGLTHHTLGNDSKALDWYEHAQALFEQAYRHWGINGVGSLERQEQCDRLIQWMSALSESITGWAAALPDGQCFSVAWFPVLHAQGSAQDDEYELVCFPTTLREAEDQIRIGDHLYTLLLPDGSPFPFPVLDFRVLHFAVEIEEDGQGGKGTLQGDLALIQGNGPDAGLAGGTGGVGQCEWGRFIRDESGRVIFVLEDPRIIGRDRTQPVAGDVIAVLRPES